MNILKKILINLSFASLLLVPAFAVGQSAFAADPVSIQDSLNQGTCLSTDPAACPDPAAAGSNVNDIVATVINIFSWVVGVVSVIMIIYGGFKYITSGGDAGGVTAAKNTILYAIVGLVIVALAQVIVQFVLTKLPS